MKIPPTRVADYRWSTTLTTRWADNDIYGHINNVAFYAFFDSATNRFLIEKGGLDLERSAVIGLVVESHCHYHAPLAYPQSLVARVRVDRLSQRSVTWGVGVFAEGGDVAAAHGSFVHVFVDRLSRQPVAIPEPMRSALDALRHIA